MPVPIRGEIAVPTNPNCILFAAPASVAMEGGWLPLQRRAWSALEQFYSQSGIDCVAYFGRRSWLDRRNRPVDQVTMMFVMDGPASSDDLLRMEHAVRGLDRVWTEGSMESMPPDAFPSLCVKSGKMYQLWSIIEGGPTFLRLDKVPSPKGSEEEGSERLAILGSRPADVGASDFIPYVRHVTVARRKIRDEDYRMERMRIAFAHHFSQRIIEADGVITGDERQFMARVFPPDIMQSMGMDSHEARKAALEEALAELPLVLGHHDKLAMIGLFFSVCHSDGALHAHEMKVLKEAASVLGVEGTEVVSYLRRLW